MRLFKNTAENVGAKRTGRALKIGSAIVAAMAVLAAATVTTAALQRDDSVTAVAIFKSASPLVPGNEVQEHGVSVGVIKDITLVRNTAHVVMQLNPEALPLHHDASAQIRPVSLLGERYIELNPGSASSPAMTAARPVIPLERTSAAVDLDQVLNALNQPTSTALAALVTTLGEGGAGRGKDAAAAIKALQPAMTDTGKLADVLNQQNGLLAHMVQTAQKSTSAVTAEKGRKLDRLLSSAQQTLATTARNREALNSTLQQLPTTLASAKKTLAELGGVADTTTPTLRSLRPTTGKLNDISYELQNFSNAADPALASLPPVLNRLNTMLDEARPVAKELRPAVSGLKKDVNTARPLADTLINHKLGKPSALEDLMDGVADWAMTTNGYDGISHYFRGILVGTSGSLFTGANGMLPGRGNLLPANTDPDEPGKSAQLPVPKLPILNNGRLPVIPGIVPHPQNPIAQDPGTLPQLPLPFAPSPPPDQPQRASAGKPQSVNPYNATGLTEQQESSLLDQLLGGGH